MPSLTSPWVGHVELAEAIDSSGVRQNIRVTLIGFNDAFLHLM